MHFAIFAKYWEPGKVKTRLARKIGNATACKVYVRFFQHLIHRFRCIGDRRTVVFSPVGSEALFRKEVPENWDLAPQAGGDLGNRMKEFFVSNSAEGIKNILIGSDTPNLPVEFVDQAFKLLEQVDVVLGPSADGGYYLVGMMEPIDIFDDVAWSTDQVLPTTLRKLDSIGKTYQLLPELKDVDEFEDLQRLMKELPTSSLQADQDLFAALQEVEILV